MRANLFFLSAACGILVLIAMPISQSLRKDALHAEAKLMLRYLATLENTYFADKGEYVAFSIPYGAKISGKDNCSRPQEAIELGFKIRNCEKSVRYVYTVSTTLGGFIGRAVSGSDEDGLSLVCGADQEDVWFIDKQRELTHDKNCKD